MTDQTSKLRPCNMTTVTIAPGYDFDMPGWEPVSMCMDANGNAVVLLRRADVAPALAERICETLFEGAASDNPWELLQIRRVLEGGGQGPQGASSEGERSGDGDTSEDSAAPDPHVPHSSRRDPVAGMMCGCGCPVDDPIHEVNDEQQPERVAACDRGGSGVDAVRVAGMADPDPVTVGSGDEVRWGNTVLRVGYTEGESLVCHYPSQHVRFNLHNLAAVLRTPDGKPVSGYDDGRGQPVLLSEWEQQQNRIAELERELERCEDDYGTLGAGYQKIRRERDEARAERGAPNIEPPKGYDD